MAIDFRGMQQMQREPTTADVATGSGEERRYFLERLTRLTKKSALLNRYLVPTDRRMRLLNHAILTTYDDCRALDAAAEAKAIIDESRREAALSVR